MNPVIELSDFILIQVYLTDISSNALEVWHNAPHQDFIKHAEGMTTLSQWWSGGPSISYQLQFKPHPCAAARHH